MIQPFFSSRERESFLAEDPFTLEYKFAQEQHAAAWLIYETHGLDALIQRLESARNTLAGALLDSIVLTLSGALLDSICQACMETNKKQAGMYQTCDMMVGADWSPLKLYRREELLMTLKNMDMCLYLEALIIPTEQFSLEDNAAYWTWIKYLRDPHDVEMVYAR